MTIDDLLTFLALIAAVYAVTSPATRLSLRLKIGILARIFVAVALIVVVLLEYYDAVEPLLHIPHFGFSTKYHTTPQGLAFLVAIVSGGVVWVAGQRSTIPARRMKKLKRLIVALI
jgi:hypothetical protein